LKTLLLLLVQDDGARTADVANAMGAHTWFIIIAIGAFLLWCISYSLQLHKEALPGERAVRTWCAEGRTDRQDCGLGSAEGFGRYPGEKYKQDVKDLKFQLSKVIEKLSPKT
jgi:hypothetical protein